MYIKRPTATQKPRENISCPFHGSSDLSNKRAMKSPRNKGKLGEYAVRDLLRGFGYKAERTPMSGAMPGWKGDITTEFGWFLEVKNTEKTQFAEWFHKAEDQGGAKPPMIVWTRNREDIYCFCRMSDFLMALKGQPVQPLKIPPKAKKLTLQESSGLAFSKEKQTHRKPKT